MSDTLVLNASLEPMSVIPLSIVRWRDAIKLMYLDRVTVLHHYDDWAVHSQKLIIPVPAVVTTVEYFNFTKAIRYSKANVYLRDLYTCQYCHEIFSPSGLTIDHVVPRAMGGKTSWDNCVAACEDCNEKKADKMEMSPKRMPYKPDSHAMAYKMKDVPLTVRHESWKQYLDIYRKIA